MSPEILHLSVHRLTSPSATTGVRMPKAHSPRFRTGFTLGGEQAEADPLLGKAFYESDDFTVIESREDARCFLVARTGGGKSAALQRLEAMHPQHVIRITPEDLSLPYITDLRVIRMLDDLEVNLDLFFIALWKHVLLVELIKHRYGVTSPQAKQNFLANLREKINKDPAKRAALDYLDEFEGKFWCEADERVREITERFEERIKDEASASVALQGFGKAGLGTDTENSYTRETRHEQAERFQRIVNDTQLARLNKMLSVLDEDILDTPHHFTYVVIDDLDRDWVDERLANDLIRCLFRTVLDLKRVRHLKVLVGLRTNIFQELDFGRKGGQEEKFRSLVLRMKWSRYDLTQMLDERARAVGARGGAGVQTIGELLPNRNRARGNPMDHVLGLTLLRPRDAIAFFNESFSMSSSAGRLTWDDIYSAEEPYSVKRLLALRDEWKPSYPDIDRLFSIFRGVEVPLSRDRFAKLLDEAMVLLADRSFEGTSWLTDLSETMWSDHGTNPEWADLYQPLTQLLYSVGFIGCATSPRADVTYAYDQPDYADRKRNLAATCCFFIHPAFRAALEVKMVDHSRHHSHG